MIFITKKAFNEEVEKRMSEIQFRTRMDEDLWKLKNRMNELEFKVRCLEDEDNNCYCKTPTGSVGNCEASF